MSKLYTAPEQPYLLRLIPTLICILILAFFVSFFYGMLIALSPLVYINFFITTLFGLTLGYGVRIISKIFKILEKKILIGLSITSGIFGVYFSWVAFMLYFVAEGAILHAYFIEFLLVFEPLVVIDILKEMNAQGLWEIFRINFKGWILSIIWIIEAGIIIGMPLKVALEQKQAPFSMSSNKWYKKYILQKDFTSIFRKKLFLEAIHENCITTINELDNGKATRFARISVYYLKEENEQYLSVENVTRAKNGKKENAQDVIHLLLISTSEARALIENYHAKEAFIFDY